MARAKRAFTGPAIDKLCFTDCSLLVVLDAINRLVDFRALCGKEPLGDILDCGPLLRRCLSQGRAGNGGKSWAAAGDESAARRIRLGCILIMIVALAPSDWSIVRRQNIQHNPRHR